MRDAFLPFSPPLIRQEEIAEVMDTLRSAWITTGPKVKRFEQEFATLVHASAGLALNSGTAALHVALATLKMGTGDAVISTPMTFCSSIHVIEHVGAEPVLVDVEPETLNIDPRKVEDVLAHRGRWAEGKKAVRAILPVHLYGHPCEMDEIIRLASSYDFAVVEDAAHALPASYNGRVIGSPVGGEFRGALLTAFSFYATKNLTTAEGGMLTGPPELIDEARIWSLHGMSRDAWKRYSSEGSWFYEVIRPGFKYNMTDVQAAIGLCQLRRLPEMQERRKRIFEAYTAALSKLPEIQVPTIRPEVDHAWHLYVIRLHLDRMTINRSRFIEEMKARNIATSVHFIPVHLHPYYRDKYGYEPEDFPVAYREYQRIVSLPLYPRMTDDDVQDVIEAVRDVVAKFRR
jgi:dTDP-4-amino-4,6-dideoxygalactose transaminase